MLFPGSNNFTQLPTSLLDAFIPGYSVLSRFLLDVLGFDISAIVSVGLLLFALSTGGQFLFNQISSQFLRWFSCSITIDAYDPIYDYILAWAAENKSLQKIRSLRGHSAGENTDEDVIGIKVDDDFAEDSIFNFNNWAAKAPPRYEPHTSSGLFWHKGVSGHGNYFSFTRSSEHVPGGWMGMMVQEQEKLTLTVLGRSTKPLKELIVEMRDRHLVHRTSMTVIRRPSPKEQRGRGRHAWNRVATRPSRPMATVVLDDVQKAAILKDINDFLHPKTPRWYANRGIPYRRGYLFYGPPGTGKTSLSFALAGVFGLDIYCLSLSEATLTEEDLILLFNSLPKRCIVLLEDIDSAGVLRKRADDIDEQADNTNKKDEKGGNHSKPNDKKDDEKDKASPEQPKSPPSTAELTPSGAVTVIATELVRAIKSATSSSSDEDSPSSNGTRSVGITMSGLLNAIDGVASQEGRILVMTTNYPEKLDDALIRPGRVDMKIEFGLARREQVRELFMRMYCVDENEMAGGRCNVPTRISDVLPKSSPVTAASAKDVGLAVSAAMSKKSLLLTPPMTPKPGADVATPLRPLTPSIDNVTATEAVAKPQEFATDLPRLAAAFANALPDATFSPAEIQGFLLTRKKSPLQAVLDVASWRDEELKRKEKRRNVIVNDDKLRIKERDGDDGPDEA
jgi:mitochondrial chaperone BCS1